MVEDYDSKRETYEACTEKLRGLLEELLEEEKVQYSWLESRTKTLQSFRGKLQEKHYRKPLRDVTDLCGLRVIVCYPDEATRVGEIIEREFAVDRQNSINKLDLLKPDQLGYLAVQYVISLGNHRSSLPEWEDCRNMKAEIQVRTLCQHSWASVDERLRYKKKSELPSDVLRRLYRIAGLLELADQEIQAVRERITTLVENYPHTAVSTWTINSYFGGEGTPNQVRKDITHAGFLEDEGDAANANELVDACTKIGLQNLADLEKFLFRLGSVRSRFFEDTSKLTGPPAWKAGPILSSLMLMYGKWPRKFTTKYLIERGWAKKPINVIRAAGRSSGLTKDPRHVANGSTRATRRRSA